MQPYRRIYLIDGVGFDSNIYLIDGEIMIDTGSGIYFKETRDEIKNLGFNLNNIRMIINTHSHFDHSGGDKKFRDLLKIPICIHAAEKKNLETGNTMAEMFGRIAKAVTVDRVLQEGDMINTRNFSFKVLHTPGHSPGSICLYEERRKILISGDTLFADGPGTTKLKGGDKNLMIDSLERLSDLNIMYLLPGHGMPKIGGVIYLIKKSLDKLQKDSSSRNIKL